MTASFLDRQPRHARLSSVARALAAACAMALVLSACGGDHDDKDETSAPTTPTTPTDPATPSTPAPVLHCAP